MRTITFDIPEYGQVTVTPWALDWTIAQYLPASPNDLRRLFARRSDFVLPQGLTVTELLAMLADLDHNTDSGPLRSY